MVKKLRNERPEDSTSSLLRHSIMRASRPNRTRSEKRRRSLVTTARTLQDQELMAKSKNLCLQNSAVPETSSQRERVSVAWEGYRSRLCKCNDFNVY